MKILIAIPCYNCANQISRSLADIASVLSDHLNILQVTIIDNQSQDSTVERAISALNELKPLPVPFAIYRNKFNVGLGGSHKVAWKLAQDLKATHLLIFHGDHQASAQDIHTLISTSLRANSATTLGSRFMSLGLLQGYSYIRILGNLGLNFIYSLFTLNRVSDLGSGLNLFNLSDIPSEKVMSFDNGFTFNMDLLLELIQNKNRFNYVPIKWSTSDQISNAKALQVGFKTLFKLWYWLRKKQPQSSLDTTTDLIFISQNT